MWFLYLALAFLVIFLALRLYIYGNDDYWTLRGVPHVFGRQIGSFWNRVLLKIPFHELDHSVYKILRSEGLGGLDGGPASKARFGGTWELRRPIAFVMDLELIKNVLVKDFDHFTNRRAFGDKDEPTLFGKMLINMENQEWKDLRSAMSPTFTTGKIKRMQAIFTESSSRAVNFMRQEIGAGAEFDVKDACSRMTLDVVASTAFGIDSQIFQDKDSMFALMVRRIQNQFKGLGAFKLFMVILLPKLFRLLGLSLMDRKAFQFFSQVTKKTIEHRQRTGERRDDFLQLLLDAREGQLTTEDDDETKATGKEKPSAVEWTDDLMLAQGLLFFIAGFDTTETLLIYALYELALNPDIQERLATEIEDAARSSPNGLSYDVVNQHEYLDMVVSETLRKYPAGARTERKCTREYQVPGSEHRILVDQVCVIPIYGIHHDPEYYPEPEQFVPERFSAENKKNRHPYTYLPFGAGPRICIAQRFAIMEGKTAIANFVRNFRFEPSGKTKIPMEFDTNGSMKPKHGMWLQVTPRGN